jgi:hypothetical protein
MDAIRDAEDDQLAGYMGGRLSDIEEKQFEKRLVDDAEFFHRMAPFLSVLYPIEPSPLEIQIRQRVEARRAAHRRATELRANRARRLTGWIAAVTTATLPVRGFAAATVAATLLMIAQLAGVFTAVPAPVYVHSTPPAQAPLQPPTTVAVVAKSTPAQTRHHTVATIPAPVTQVAELPAPGPVDTAGAQVVARLDSEPLPNAGAIKITVDARRVIRSVAAFDVPTLITVDTLPGSWWQDTKNNLAHGTKRVLGAIIDPIDVIIQKARKKKPHFQGGLP